MASFWLPPASCHASLLPGCTMLQHSRGHSRGTCGHPHPPRGAWWWYCRWCSSGQLATPASPRARGRRAGLAVVSAGGAVESDKRLATCLAGRPTSAPCFSSRQGNALHRCGPKGSGQVQFYALVGRGRDEKGGGAKERCAGQCAATSLVVPPQALHLSTNSSTTSNGALQPDQHKRTRLD